MLLRLDRQKKRRLGGVNEISIDDFVLSKSEVSIFSLQGEDLSAKVSMYWEQGNTIIETSDLRRGMYLLKVKSSVKLIYKH